MTAGCSVGSTSGRLTLLAGLATGVLTTAHIGTIFVDALVAGRFPDWVSSFLALTLWAAGAVCLRSATAIGRGDVSAQKRVLLASMSILGLTSPLATEDAWAAAIGCLAFANVLALLFSRSNPALISAPAASSR